MSASYATVIQAYTHTLRLAYTHTHTPLSSSSSIVFYPLLSLLLLSPFFSACHLCRRVTPPSSLSSIPLQLPFLLAPSFHTQPLSCSLPLSLHTVECLCVV